MREEVYTELTETNDITIYDPTSVNWTKFEWTNGFFKHTITKAESFKPYLISYKYYGDSKYEDIILLLNGIDDVFNIQVSAEIRVPKLEDIESFLLKAKNDDIPL